MTYPYEREYFLGYPAPIPAGCSTGPDPWTPGQRRAEGYGAVQRYDVPGWTVTAPDGHRYSHPGALFPETALELTVIQRRPAA